MPSNARQTRSWSLASVACVPLVLLSPTVTFAQSFPTQPVRIVAATPPGGAADVNARRLADKLSRTWKQPVVVIASLQRSAVLPDIPTFEESGLRRFESVIAHGVLVPAKTPDAMVMTLNRAINETLHDPQIGRASCRERV